MFPSVNIKSALLCKVNNMDDYYVVCVTWQLTEVTKQWVFDNLTEAIGKYNKIIHSYNDFIRCYVAIGDIIIQETNNEVW